MPSFKVHFRGTDFPYGGEVQGRVNSIADVRGYIWSPTHVPTALSELTSRWVPTASPAAQEPSCLQVRQPRGARELTTLRAVSSSTLGWELAGAILHRVPVDLSKSEFQFSRAAMSSLPNLNEVSSGIIA